MTTKYKEILKLVGVHIAAQVMLYLATYNLNLKVKEMMGLLSELFPSPIFTNPLYLKYCIPVVVFMLVQFSMKSRHNKKSDRELVSQ